MRALRKARGWRQIDLAEHSGINVIYLSYLERGKKEVCLRNLEVLALTFEKSLSEFLKGL
ncbi:helix-turn-helix domain-containing protein [Terriglobus tenax]|uniref:helix-turn-helix domain-containing protein n=1 Tax=Terriglobus tenax TaxID=1111115 RepID=UPI0021E01B0F|nr:helix-turn-helix transcriptional regulator [Terriglobus tenax]